ncbi:restriction endonuclease subunit S [Lactobacillus jensenii]|uniref:restriction endonuclease subunit S n=1 Tax=Lactobacillus jensenii TaxID=109790 RepID=UPI000C7CEEEE|nr:restriction endonuclease subunit S [Lactobacillus jensenii]MDK6783017.1 restriction endonuclease subunit S [Lactobacillus jensenii]PLA44167.1 type I restriction endonuclease subunit S [Lactobacillus jensenii]TVV15026.1 restriction endonuclease subunit S [Lactobacillus jensenii]
MYPKVRFRGFDEPWKKVKLGEISEKITQKNNNSCSQFPVLTNSAEYGIVYQKDFFDKNIAINTDNYYVVHTEDFVYNPRISKQAPYGPIRVNHLKTGVMSPLYYIFKIKDDFNIGFFEFLFIGNKWHKFMYQNGDSGARSDRYAIKDKVFNKLPIYIPQKIEEQKLIFEINHKINSLLYLQQRKLELENKLKKQIAFYLYSFTLTPNFKHIEVKNKKLGDIVNISNGIMGDSQKKSGNFKLTRIETISNGKIDLSRTGYIDQVSDEKKFLEVGDILYSNINSLTHIGKNAIVKEKHLPLVHGINLFRLHITNNQITPNYLHGLLNLPKYKWWVKSHANPAVNQASINKTELSSLVIKYPDLDIQNQINNINYSFAQYWDIQYSKKESLCQLKQFLLQNLFI